MKNATLPILLLMLCFGLAFPENVKAQDPAYTTSFLTSYTYQNVGTADANITFTIYYEDGSSFETSRTLPQGAGDSIFISGLVGPDPLPGAPLLTVAISSNQPIVILQVLLPESTTVKNRPLSGVPFFGDSQLNATTILKNKFGATSILSVQNIHSTAVDITASFYNADNPTATPIVLSRDNIAPHFTVTLDLGKLSELPTTFNGSAVFRAVEHQSTTPAPIIGNVLELETADVGARSIEMVTGSSTSLYAATALCNAFGGYTTAFAIQNIDLSDSTLVTIQYSNGTFETKEAGAGGKASFNTCQASGMPDGFSGAAFITSSKTEIMGVGKATGNGLYTGFLLESTGGAKLALPYVRYCLQADYDSGRCQRANIAIQNIGAAVSNVQVVYLNKVGTVVGTHTIASIAPDAKANSNPVTASLASSAVSNALEEFGMPASNPGGGFGGAVIIEGPAGSQLIALARVSSKVNGKLIAEDYNAVPIQ